MTLLLATQADVQLGVQATLPISEKVEPQIDYEHLEVLLGLLGELELLLVLVRELELPVLRWHGLPFSAQPRLLLVQGLQTSVQ